MIKHVYTCVAFINPAIKLHHTTELFEDMWRNLVSQFWEVLKVFKDSLVFFGFPFKWSVKITTDVAVYECLQCNVLLGLIS